MKKHVIFDFDGTIFNSNDIIVDSWQAVFMHYYGKPGDVNEILETFGETIAFTVEKFFPDEDPAEAVSVYRSYQAAHYEGKIDLFPGTQALIKKLRAMGRTVSLVTSRTKKTCFEYLNALDIEDLFDVIVTCDDVTEHKPHPGPLFLALEKLGAVPEDAIMLGDTKFDMGCAKNAGVESVLVGWSHPVNMDEIIANGWEPAHVINDPEEMLDLV